MKRYKEYPPAVEIEIPHTMDEIMEDVHEMEQLKRKLKAQWDARNMDRHFESDRRDAKAQEDFVGDIMTIFGNLK